MNGRLHSDQTRGYTARSEISTEVRLIAFYLPQYHRIPENDAAWGEGFTEWTNVRKASPLIPSHYQPHVPLRQDYYSLEDHSTLIRQSKLAGLHGIHGFCYYYYWFDGRRLLEKPLDEMLRRGTPEFPFCLCWANETWTRRWDGGSDEIIVDQPYEKVDDLVSDLLPFFRDSRYITIDGRALLLIYRPAEIPKLAEVISVWRNSAEQAGIRLFVAGCLTDDMDPQIIEALDGLYEFPPVAMHLRNLRYQALPAARVAGMVHDYQAAIVKQTFQENFGRTVFRGVMPSWDNTPRRGSQGRFFVNSDPDAFRVWISALINDAKRKRASERIIFINAWNEWGEGAHLEPDEKYGFAWLEACTAALAGAVEEMVAEDEAPAAIWSKKFALNPNVWLALADAALERGDGEEALRHLAMSPDSGAQDPVHLLLRAKALLEMGRYEDAKTAILRSAELNPGACELFLEQGAILMRLEEWEQAETIVEAAREAITETDCIYERLRRWYWRQAAQIKAHIAIKKEEEAIKFTYGGLADTTDAQDYLFLGDILSRFQRWDEVIKAQITALAMNPNLSAAHRSLSVGLVKAGRLDEALASAERLLELRPDDAESYVHLGWVYSNREEWDQVLEACETTLRLDPSLIAATRLGCKAAIRLNHLDVAAAYADQIVEVQREEASAHLLRGQVMMNLQNWDLALDSFTQALSIEPDLVAARKGILNSLVKLDRAEEATTAAYALLPLVTEDTSGILLCGTAFMQAERLADAVDAMHAVLRLEAKQPTALKMLINALLKLEDFKKAAAAADALQPEARGDISGLLLCAQAFIKGERWVEAAEALRGALELDANRPIALRMLTNVLIRLERFEDALRSASQLTAITPDDTSAEHLLSRVLHLRRIHGEAKKRSR